MIRTPQCLHIPTLHENERSTITWQGYENIDRYELEGAFDQSFQEAVVGSSWYDIKRLVNTWKTQHAKDKKWKEIHQQQTRGLTWRNLHGETKKWGEIHNTAHSWGSFVDKPASLVIYCGPGVEIANSQQDGYKWGDAKAVLLDWRKFHSADQMWKEIEAHEGHKDHVGAEIGVSFNSKQAQFRIRSFDGEAHSAYFTADMEQIVPVYDRGDVIQFPVQKGQQYFLQVIASSVPFFGGIHMQLTYDKDTLELNNLSEGSRDKAEVRILAQHKGLLRFTCFKEIPDAMEWSGTILLLELSALKTGTATIELE